MKTRFSKFFNIPELMNMFKSVADIKTADVLNLPVPKANYHTVVTEASEYQKDMIDGLAERANKIRKGGVDSRTDNMLNVTNDGRKLALDQRLLNPLLPDEPTSKTNICVDNVYKIWQQTAPDKLTQMIFCDLSTPHYDGRYNVYDDVKNKLISKGIPSEEIAFIHDCKTDEEKQALFRKVQNGEVRVLLGSTSKMGTGTNCQRLLKAVHHLDCPWRPADLEQRNGRIIRQGNSNDEVDIYTYISKGTFDNYLYQLLENKQKFISQILTSKSPARSAEDVDECVLNYAQIKALATGDPRIKEKMDLDIEVNKLKAVYANYLDNKAMLQENISKTYPQKISYLKELIDGLTKDLSLAQATASNDFTHMVIDGKSYTDKKEAGTAFLESCRKYGGLYAKNHVPENIGEYRGFKMSVSFDSTQAQYKLCLKGAASHNIEIGTDIFGNLTRIDNAIGSIEKKLAVAKMQLEDTEHLLAVAKEEVKKPFAQKEELQQKEARLNELGKELSIDNSSTENISQNKANSKENPCL